MEKKGWKTLAIIFIILFGVLLSLEIWVYIGLVNEAEKQVDCYYDVCGEYPDAWLEEDVCSCYDYDLMGDLVVAKTEVMK